MKFCAVIDAFVFEIPVCVCVGVCVCVSVSVCECVDGWGGWGVFVCV